MFDWYIFIVARIEKDFPEQAIYIEREVPGYFYVRFDSPGDNHTVKSFPIDMPGKFLYKELLRVGDHLRCVDHWDIVHAKGLRSVK